MELQGTSTHRRLDWLLPSWLEDVDAFSQSTDEDLSAVAYTVAVNLLLLLLCVLVSSFVRQRRPLWYIPKRFVAPERTPSETLSNETWFGWLLDVARLQDDVLISKGGFDAYILIRFYTVCFKILGVSALFCCLVLLPLDGLDSNTDSWISYDRWSMTNVSQGSSLCWLHLLGTYLVTGITIYYVEQEFIIYAKVRHDFLRQTTAHLRTVLIEGIPHKLRSPNTLRAYLNHLYPDGVRHIRVGINIRYLQKLIADRDIVVNKLDHLLYQNHNERVRPTVKVSDMNREVDGIMHYSQVLQEYNTAVANEQSRILRAIGWKKHQSALEKSTTIEEFLRVTEISGPQISRSAKLRSTKPRSNASLIDLEREDIEEYSSYQAGEYESFKSASNRGQSEDNLELLISGAAVLDDSSVDDDEDDDGLMYTLSCTQYLKRIFGASSMSECWYHLRQGRHIDDYLPINKSPDADESGDHTDESTGLIPASEENRLYLSKAFITFKSFTAATTAKQVIHMQLAGRMAVSEAPEPGDMNWNNMYVTRKQTIFRRYIVEALVVLLIIVWVAPITLMSYVFSYDALTSFIPCLGTWADESALFESLLDLIQPLMIVALMNLLPPLLTALATFEGCIAMSVNQERSFHRYFAFQVVNVFLVIVIAGSVIDCLTEIYNSPNEAFELLGTSLPSVAGFFTNYILFKAYTGLGLEILRFPSMFMYGCKLLFTTTITPRDRKSIPMFGALRDILNPGWFPYNKILAQDALVFVICVTYSCIAPFIILAGLGYFSMAIYVYRHQMIYVYEPIYETGGKWWPIMARCIVVALLFAQATMVGMMILKETYIEIYFLALLFFATLGYFWHVSSIYVPLANQLPLDMAVSMDRDPAVNSQNKLHGEDDYMQPSLRAQPAAPIVEFSLESDEGCATLV